MKIFLSYGHDANAPLVHKIKEYLSKDSEGNAKHEVWIDTSEIKAGNDWRDSITDGIIHSDVVIAGLSQHSTRNPGVCRDELSISIGVMGGNIKPVLLEPADIVAAPAMLSHIQWVDMSEWKQHVHEGFDSKYFKEKFNEISKMIDTPENERYNGDITRLKDKLHPISSLSRIQSLTSKQMYGRQWLYKKIEEWDKADKERIFWIVGGPGFGKSTFAANLQKSAYSGKIPAIQFVEWGKPNHSNPCNILRNLAFQLAVRYPDYMRFVLALPQLDELLEMTEYELFDILFCESTFMKIDGGHESVWFLIDALDEANDEYGNKIAQTIARHIDRIPKWIKFILTSRDDSKVMLPLQRYHPQVFDLEEYVKNKNFEDLKLYLKGELESLNPTDEQIQKILSKGQGVFLYLSLCVESILNGTYSLDDLGKLPDGLNGYYFELFTRQFGNDIARYKKNVRPILQVMVASPCIVSLPFILNILAVDSENEFYDDIQSLEHVCRISQGNGKETITFFHNSIENWLQDRSASGMFYVSKSDGLNILLSRYKKWLSSEDDKESSFWMQYGYGLSLFTEKKEPLTNYHKDKIAEIFESMRSGSGIGGYTRDHNTQRELMLSYCDMLLRNDDEDNFLSIIIELFEHVKDRYIEIGIVNPETRTSRLYAEKVEFNGTAIFQTVRNSGTIGYICRNLFEKEILCSNKTYRILIRIIRILAYYASCILDPYESVPSLAFEDVQDFSIIELSELANMLEKNMPLDESETLIGSNSSLFRRLSSDQLNLAKRVSALFEKDDYKELHPNWKEEDFEETTWLLIDALKKHTLGVYNLLPPNYKMKKHSYPLGGSIVHTVSD